jgi:hypothetical protein
MKITVTILNNVVIGFTGVNQTAMRSRDAGDPAVAAVAAA